MEKLNEYVRDQIWILEYPVRFAGRDIFGRTTIIRLENGDLIVHDPCKIDDATKREIDEIGKVKYIIAPGSYHYLFVTDFQKQYPDAETFLCPGLERKRPDIITLRQEKIAWKAMRDVYETICLKNKALSLDDPIPSEDAVAVMDCYITVLKQTSHRWAVDQEALGKLLQAWQKNAQSYADGKLSYEKYKARDEKAWKKYEKRRKKAGAKMEKKLEQEGLPHN